LIYINGKQDNTVASMSSISGTTLYLGGYGSGSGLTGSLDQFAIYSQSIQSP
jgi:hypothetical protein